MTKKECASCISFIRYYDMFWQRKKNYGKCEKINEKNIRVNEEHICEEWRKTNHD